MRRPACPVFSSSTSNNFPKPTERIIERPISTPSFKSTLPCFLWRRSAKKLVPAICVRPVATEFVMGSPKALRLGVISHPPPMPRRPLNKPTANPRNKKIGREGKVPPRITISWGKLSIEEAFFFYVSL